MLLAGLGRLVPLPPASLGMLVSPLLTYGAVVAAWPLLAGDRRAYALFAGLLLAGPFSFYFAVPYSESLFLLLTVVAFARLGRGDFLGAGLAGALLSATRTVGVLFLGAMLVAAACTLGRRPLAGLKAPPHIILGLLLGPAGLCAFMAWLYLVSGDALAFAHIQRGWDRVATDPVTALWTALTEPIGQVRAAPLMALAALAGLALSAGLAWRRKLPAAVFCALAIALALTQGVESQLRFVAALAPLNLLLARLLARPSTLFWLSLLVFGVLDFVLTLGWMDRQGALM
jgi:hypothetical protein